MLKSLQKPLLKLNWEATPLSQSRKRESFCVPFQHPHPLFRTLNHAVGVSQSEERLATYLGSWASEENLFPFQMPSVQTYL